MAAGPLFAHSEIPVTTGTTFPNVYVGGGANSKHEEGLGVAASLAADATWRLRFQLPPAIPSGTAKLLLRALANATTGNAKVTPQLAKVAGGSSPSGATLTAEAQQTITWTAVDVYVDTKVTLTNTTIAAGDENKALVCDLVFNATGWTLAAVSTWQASLIWE
jgi:hypothetical protein